MSTKRLNDTIVPESLYHKAQALKKAGGRVFLVIGDDRAQKSNTCGNCNGTGAVGLQYFTGGPYNVTPTIQNNPPPNQPQNVPARATFYDGKWYKQKTRTESCPVCEGTGIGQQKPERTRELAF